MKPEAEDSADRLWSWIAQYGHTKQPEFIADLKAVLEHAFPEQPQPAKDPDEWVVQDRVPARSDVDKCWCINPLEPLPADPEFMWSIQSNGFFSSKMHGDETRYGTVHVMCRRRDLPKVEQVVCDECGGSGEVDSGGFTPWMAPINVPCGKCSKPEPQPQKTRVRLWCCDTDGVVVAEDNCPAPGWHEIHHDSEGFYTID